MKVSDILHGNTQEILRKTGYDKRKDGHEIIDYYKLFQNNDSREEVLRKIFNSKD